MNLIEQSNGSISSNNKFETKDAIRSIGGTLYSVITLMLDRPHDLIINTTKSESTIQFQVIVHPSDIGKLLGRQGRTARSIRVVFQAMCRAHSDVAFQLDIVDIAWR